MTGFTQSKDQELQSLKAAVSKKRGSTGKKLKMKLRRGAVSPLLVIWPDGNKVNVSRRQPHLHVHAALLTVARIIKGQMKELSMDETNKRGTWNIHAMKHFSALK